MNYGLEINGFPADLNFIKYAGWDENNDCFKSFFSQETICLISKKVSELTKGVDPYNRTIIIPDYRIAEVMNTVWWHFRPPTGDIFSRYIVPNNEQGNMVQSMIDQTIGIIFNNIVNEAGMEEANRKLTAWTQVLGNFNAHSLRSHPILKMKDSHVSYMQFNMNY